MPKLEPFDVAEWRKGLKLDFSSKVWGGRGWHKGGDGKLTRAKNEVVRIHKEKPVKVAREIKPAIGVLCGDGDSGGRSLAEHRALVESYGRAYDKGLSPLTGEPITDPSEAKGIAKPRVAEGWREGRNAAYTDMEGLALLTTAFKAFADENSDDE